PAAAAATRAGQRVSSWSAQALAEAEPGLAPAGGALVFPEDGQVDARALVTALSAALTGRGVPVAAHCPAEALLLEDGAVIGLRTAAGPVRGEVVLATGAAPLGLPLEEAGQPRGRLSPPVRPVKGQMAALILPPDAPTLHRVVWAPGLYLVPREGRRVLVGASVEEAGFDARVTAGVIAGLLARAAALCPALAEAELAEVWSGFRPATPDHLPLIGPSERRGLHLALGHYRHGILLAPATARLMAGWLTGAAVPEALLRAAEPLRPDRFPHLTP
ncbi:MAG: FAD-dependent oxidoreductase, partial [Alphaproteobacteria bacterium]|nr:FAD-dependent oxidoreductase [Alphaproteobacteria bacterium]